MYTLWCPLAISCAYTVLCEMSFSFYVSHWGIHLLTLRNAGQLEIRKGWVAAYKSKQESVLFVIDLCFIEGLPVLRGCYQLLLFKTAHKILFIMKAAQTGNLLDRNRGISQ